MVFLLIVFIVFCFACSSSAKSQFQNVSNKQNESQVSLKTESKKSEDEVKFANNFFANEEYKGCWSSYDGKVLSIEDDKIKVWTKDFKPVNYQKIDIPLEEPGVLLQLFNRPQFYYFQEYIFIQMSKVDEDNLIRIKFYSTYENFVDNKSVGISAFWVKESDCKKFFPDNG